MTTRTILLFEPTCKPIRLAVRRLMGNNSFSARWQPCAPAWFRDIGIISDRRIVLIKSLSVCLEDQLQLTSFSFDQLLSVNNPILKVNGRPRCSNVPHCRHKCPISTGRCPAFSPAFSPTFSIILQHCPAIVWRSCSPLSLANQAARRDQVRANDTVRFNSMQHR